jgi:hypothetical protein
VNERTKHRAKIFPEPRKVFISLSARDKRKTRLAVLISPAEKHCWLICYEKKILFQLKKQAKKYGL